jgi:SAM-dependent methyltransferase
LDVGCAAGFFLDVAHEAGWQATGVELSPYMSEQARQRGLDVKTGSLEEVDFPLGAFDLISMWDMIEHAQHPRAVLERAFELLAPGGLLVAATGDIAGATARIYGAKWGLLAPPGHLFYFSRRTLFAMFAQTGFKPLEWQSDGTFLVNQRETFLQAGGWKRAVVKLQRPRPIKAVLRRLKLGSIMTVFARKP